MKRQFCVVFKRINSCRDCIHWFKNYDEEPCVSCQQVSCMTNFSSVYVESSKEKQELKHDLVRFSDWMVYCKRCDKTFQDSNGLRKLPYNYEAALPKLNDNLECQSNANQRTSEGEK